MKSLNEHDEAIFYLNVAAINWHEYMEKYVLGVRRYLLKEDPSTLPKARMRLRR